MGPECRIQQSVRMALGGCREIVRSNGTTTEKGMTMTRRITSGQRDGIVELARARTAKVVDAMGLDSDSAQLVIMNGHEFGQIVGDAVRAALTRLSVSQQFVDEEVESNWTYPDEYTGPAPIGEQVGKLAALFGLSLGETMRFVEQALPMITLPDGAEGWFAIPKVEAIAARYFKNVTNPNERYIRAVLMMFDKIKQSRMFYNYRDGEITADRLHQQARTVAMLELIGETQKGDIIVIPAQFGLRHRGRSVRRGGVVYTKSEFGLGSFAAGSMALTHPARFVRWDQLHVDCAGDEFAPKAGGVFSNAPCWYFSGDRLEFGSRPVGIARPGYGSASAFLPE